MRRYWTIALLGISLTLTGCGTITRFTSPHNKERLYPATHADGDFIGRCLTPVRSENYAECLILPVIFVDMPLSIALDTVLFPYDWYRYSHRNDYVHK